MPSEIGTALIGVASALVGTAIGGLISYFTTKDMKRREWLLSVARDEINEKKKLYAEFLSEGTRLTLVAFERKKGDLKELHQLGNLLAQIELLSSPEVVKTSKAILDHVLSQHTHDAGEQERTFFDVKSSFVNAVKVEIYEIKNS